MSLDWLIIHRHDVISGPAGCSGGRAAGDEENRSSSLQPQEDWALQRFGSLFPALPILSYVSCKSKVSPLFHAAFQAFYFLKKSPTHYECWRVACLLSLNPQIGGLNCLNWSAEHIVENHRGSFINSAQNTYEALCPWVTVQGHIYCRLCGGLILMSYRPIYCQELLQVRANDLIGQSRCVECCGSTVQMDNSLSLPCLIIWASMIPGYNLA